MNTTNSRATDLVFRGLIVSFAALSVIASSSIDAARTSAETMANFTQFPVVGTSTTVAPQVVLNVSRDHQLFYKAYNDYTDLDGNGTPETTYKHSIDYYGYFDSKKCYTYDTGTNRFVPANAVDATGYCPGQWHGNFMNWVSMSRMDAVRKLLYGGKRSTDSGSLTVLERSHLPRDAHSWAKFYNGDDISKLTPFTPPTVPTSVTVTLGAAIRLGPYSPDTDSTPGWNVAPWNAAVYDNTIRFPLGTVLNYHVGDQIRIAPAGSTTNFMVGGVVSVDQGNGNVELRIDPNSVIFNGQKAVPGDAALQATSYTVFTLTNLSITGISFCNLTNPNNVSQADTAPPIIRAVSGNYELWGANERSQCHWFEERNNGQAGFYAGFRSNGNRAVESGLNASAEHPRRASSGYYTTRALGVGQGNGEYVARTEVCKTGLIGTERCKTYPSGASKPIGLLQQYGDEGDLKFALFTPTWHKNVSGGVLRRAMADMRAEINVATNGTVIAGVNGIISTIDRFRMFGYLTNGTYLGGCDYQLIGIAPTANSAGRISGEGGQCSGWGNPISELYIESLRYLAGSSPNSAFAQGAEDVTLGLTSVTTWVDPVEPARYCSPMNVINFNASTSSYDGTLSGTGAIITSGLDGAPAPVSLTNQVGVAEGLTGNVFIGENGVTDDNLCSIKPFTTLGAMKGICPEAGALEGSYLMAGMAWWARTNKIRATPAVPTTDTQSLKVTTYGIQLATNTPKIEVVLSSGSKVTILPAYRLDLSSNGAGPFGGGAIVDFRIIALDVANGYGKFYVNWEDSAQGGDYDQDMWGYIEYQVVGSKIRVTTDAVSASTGNGQGFGYIISGTTDDGPHFHSGIYNFDYTDITSPSIFVGSVAANGVGSINASGGCTNCTLTDPPTTAVYDVASISTAAAKLLNDPLWYASKYGGFTDTNNNDLPDLVSEWDAKQADGSPGSDGVPDTYFLVTNPGALEESLARVFQAILSKTSSGTAAAVVANSSRGFGAVFQALFEARRTDSLAREARWLGDIQGMWVDSAGLLREDLNDDKRLGTYVTDPVIQFYFDTNVQPPRARFKRLNNISGNPDIFQSGPAGPDGLPPGTALELENLATLWNARKTMANLTPGALDAQRAYTGDAAANRHILTWIDGNLDGKLTQNEVKPFEWGANGFTATNFGFLNSNNVAEAKNIVNWVRGVEDSSLRNRLLDYDSSGTSRVQRLGDIVNSTPVAVGSPAEAFNLLYGDSTYSTFASRYTPRRQIVLVGANDGMLHAFHGGFFDQRTLRFAQSAGTATSQKLGTELWAYVPGNILPHLRWLADKDYTHVFSVDGSPYVFDANVFAASGDARHVSGWGTIAAVNFRTGGGSITVDTANDGLAGANRDNNEDDDHSSHAATVLLDITSPEVAPRVLAEIPVDEGWQLGRPTTIAFREVSGPLNKWFLVVPSGPNRQLNAGRVVSNRAFSIRIYDIATLATGDVDAALVHTLTGTGTLADFSFAMDPITADFDLDYKAEAIYFGTVKAAASGAEFDGSLYKINTGESADPTTWTLALMHDAQRPITVRPTVALDDRGERYAYVGTGRLLSPFDADSTEIQRIYGIKDTSLSPGTPAALPVAAGSLRDVTAVEVTADGRVDGTTDFDDYLDTFDAASVKGWFRNLQAATPGVGGSERVVSNQAVIGGLLLTTTYIPSIDLCANLGKARLFVVNYKAGVSSPSMGAAQNGGIPPAADTVISPVSNLGPGVPSAPTIAIGQGQGQSQSRVCSQTSTGAIICQDLQSEQLLRSGDASWRQPSN